MSKKLALSIARQRLAYGGAPFFSYDYRDIAFPEVQQPPTFNPPDFSQQPLPPLSDISLYGTPGGPQPRPFEPYVPPTPTVPNAPQAPTTGGGGGDGSGGFGGTFGGDYGQTNVDQGDLGQPGSFGSAIGNIGSGIANAAGYGQGMTVGNTIGGVLGGVLGTAVAGPIGGILGGIAGRHAANAMAEPETMDSSATKEASPGATDTSGSVGDTGGPSSQSSPGSMSAAAAEAAEAAAANMGDMGGFGATAAGEGATEGATAGGETGGPGIGGGSAAGVGAGAGAGEGEGDGDGDSGGGVGGVGGDAGGGGGGEGGGGGGDGMGGMSGESAGDAGGEAGGESGGGESGGGGGEGGFEYGGRVGYADGGETVEFYPDPESQLPESMRGQVMAPADQTIRQRMADFLATAGGTRDESAVTRRFGEGMADVVGMTPVGIPMAYEETQRAMRKGDYPEAALSAVGMIPGARPAAKVATETAKEVLTRAADNPRVNMNYKNVKERVPELTAGAKALEEGKIDSAEYQRLGNAHKPVSPWEAVPQPATYEEMYNALRVTSRDKIGKGAEIPSGYPVGLRLDIPAYTGSGTWVPTIHDAAGGSAKVIAHEPVAMISDVSFTIPESKAFNVATGATKKSPFAKIDGKWMPVTQQDAMSLANEAIKNPKEWRQVGMDPERHSYFYDRATQEPIISAEQVLQVGPLVLARNPTYGDKSAFKYRGGGSVTDHARMILSRKA